MLSFSIPRITADRIARLGLACDTSTPSGTLNHIGIRATTSAVRFSATNGRILASLLVPVDDIEGTPGDLILDREQFTAALKATAKVAGGRIQVRIDDQEARLTNGTAAAVVRRVSGTYPNVDHVWTRPSGRRWVPTMSCLDPNLVGIAQKVSGNKAALLFASPMEPGARLERLWAVPGAALDETVCLTDLRAAITAPAYWADHELAFLVMPITRGDAERQLDLSQHALALPQLVAAAA